MKRFVRFLSVVICILLLVALSSCSTIDKSLDTRALAHYLQFFDQPEILPIYSYEKAEFDGEVFYYLDRGPYDEWDEDSIKLIVVYNTSTRSFKSYFWLDMEYGLHSEVKSKWEKRDTDAKSVYVFSEEEIETLRKEAIDYCKANKD